MFAAKSWQFIASLASRTNLSRTTKPVFSRAKIGAGDGVHYFYAVYAPCLCRMPESWTDTPRRALPLCLCQSPGADTSPLAASRRCMLAAALLVLGLMYEQGDWSSLWWLPNSQTPAAGQQAAVRGDRQTLPHLIFVPSRAPPPDGWPLLVFLHGQGESSGASALPNVALQGPPQQAGRHPGQMPFAVLSPQKPLEAQFFDDAVATSIVALVDKYIAEFKLDASRVYLTGVSQGGIGTWGLASDPRFAHRFAAVAPVCGGFVRGGKKAAAAVLADTPTWALSVLCGVERVASNA